MSKELNDLKIKLESMNMSELQGYIVRQHYEFSPTGTKDEIINQIMGHEALKPNIKYRYKTVSESYYGEVLNIEDIGNFINEAISEFKKSNVTPVSKVLIEIDEILSDLVFIQGYKIKVINVDLHNEFKVGGINE